MKKSSLIGFALALTAFMTGLQARFAFANPIPPSLGSAANYALVDLGHGTTIGMNSGPLTGSVLLGNGVNASFSGGNNGQITGTLYYDNTVTGTNTFHQLQTALTTQMVSTTVTQQALTDAQAASTAASALAATQTFTNINSATTINGNGGLNVIDVNSVQNAPLTIHGSASDVFVFNVSGNFNTNQSMTLTGGVTASHILFNLTGTSGNIFQTSGGDTLFGTFLATHGGSFQFSNLNLTGELINTGGNVQFVSGSTVPIFAPYDSPVPEPSTFALLGLGGIAIAIRSLRMKR